MINIISFKKSYTLSLKITILFFVIALTAVFCFPETGACQQGQDKKNKSLQQFEGENFSFEDSTLKNWTLSGTGFRAEVDQNTAAHGRQSLRLYYAADQVYYGLDPLRVASSQLPTAPFRGKRIRVSAALKTRDAGPALLWARADAGKDNPTAFTRLPWQEAPKGSQDWQRYSIEMDVPADTTSLLFGTACYGKGTTWIDAFSVAILPARGPITIVIGGRVVDEQGNPVPDALVGVNTFYRETALACTTSDEKGNFAFHLPPGFYYLSASAAGLTAGRLGPKGFYEKDVTDLVIPLKGDGFTVKGKIETAGKKLPPGSYVVLDRLNFLADEIFCTRPQPDGSFQIKVPVGDAYKVYLDVSSSRDSSIRFPPVMVAATDKKPCVLKAFAVQPAPVEVVDWMKQQAVPLRTAEAGHGFADLMPLKKIIGSARVVGLGETSHGTRENFRMKHRLFEFLVKEMGFTIFAMECHWPESLAVNEYVLHGRGDPVKALAGLNSPWICESVLAFIKWMRAYNADPAHLEKLKFFGVDVHRSGAAFISRYLEKVDPQYLKQGEWEQTLAQLEKSAPFRLVYRSPEQEGCYSLPQKLNELLSRFDRHKERYTAASSSEEWLLNRQHVRHLEQLVDCAVAGRESDYDSFAVRDRAMADNVRWILDNEPAGTRVVYWAHNFHVGLTKYPGWSAKPAGMNMRRMLGNDYLSIGFAFNRGTFRSRDSTIAAYKTHGAARCFTVESYPGSFGAAMSRTGMPIFFLDLRSIPAAAAGHSDIVHQWFAAPHILKSIDSVFTSETDIKHLFRLPQLFDAVIFFETTTPTRTVSITPLPVTFF